MEPTLIAGYPDRYPNVYHRLRVAMGDMAVILIDRDGAMHAIVRNIEVGRTRASGRFAEVYAPEDLVAPDRLSPDRNTAFAQAAAELLDRLKIREVRTDAMLPILFATVLDDVGLRVRCEPELGIMERRRKDDWEIGQLRTAQQATESAIRLAAEIIQSATVDDGVLVHENRPLTSERLRAITNAHLLTLGCEPSDSIIASGPTGSDCHDRGSGPIRAGEPIILDIFPMLQDSRYWGDCTRTLVRGDVSPTLMEMHQAVIEAKAAAIEACRAGVTGAAVHKAAADVFRARGYHIGLPPADAPADLIFYPHGTGHGIGLEGHEPPFLDERGVELVEGDALTIEPGLYCRSIGGIRVEDMVIVREHGCENLNSLPEGLHWS